MTFCKGKSILVKDTQKLTKYIDLCLQTPVSYKGIQQSVGYNEIISAQFNFKEFNQTLFPQFINLIGRDFKELDQKEFHYFNQALSCYIESANTRKKYDKKIFENVVNQLSLNATYIQKCTFFLNIYWFVTFYKAISQSQQTINKFQIDLFQQIPQTVEEKLWRICIEMQHLQMNKKNQLEQDNVIKIQEQKTMERFFDLIEAIAVNLPNFTNIMSRFILLKYYQILKHFNVQNFDKRIHNLLFSVYTASNNYITENLSQLNSFSLYLYIDLVSKNKDLFQSAKWDILLNEVNSKNFNEMAIFDVLALFSVIHNNGKLTTQLSNRIIQHLYENINSINPDNYADVFQVLASVQCDLNDKFVTKLQTKVVPKDLSLEHISIILSVLQRFHRIDENILEKYLVGIGSRVNNIDKDSATGILTAINYLHQQNPVIFSQVSKLKLEDDQDKLLQIEILKYLQLHDPENEKVQQIQEDILKIMKKNYDFQLMCSFLEVLLHINETTSKTIELLPELKQYVNKCLDQIRQDNERKDELSDEVLEFLVEHYNIDFLNEK